ncbi:unnamed protein product [Agarophyton chilense]|eukprot:gb/GEZJ01002892.1/.p1 GENE.gb/GEZJ01002892.1/~~gb/GEZJ01002892.1/.p1  ORF type:complete len:640 (-),score=51.29 gb/GEZJ01002892.1/:291-2210(-)
MSAESPNGRRGIDPNSTNQHFPSLSEFLQQGTVSESLGRRKAWLYFGGTIIAFAIVVTMWSTSSASRRATQCPDCNCGADGGAPPVSYEGAEAALGIGLSIFTIQLTLCIFATYILVQNRLIFLPSCIAYVLLGVLVGSIVRVSGAASALGFSLPNQEQFFTFILPPIMLEAGYSLNKADFYAEGLGILLLAVPGTLISALAFGIGMYVAGLLGISYFFSFWEAMTFGALLSAVDPVATIAIFSALKVNKTLHFLVFGESVLNDAVAIVLYRTFSRLIGYAVTSWYGPLFKFIYIFFGSLIVGALLAASAALLLKHTNLYRSPSLEFSFYLLMAYLPYPFCDGIGMSGILGILTSSVVLAHYAHYNLSKVTQISSQQVFRSLAFLAETFVFIYLGTALTTFNHSWHITTIVWGIIFTLVSRAANIYPLTNLLNRYRSDKISKKTQLIMWFSGSLRGAIAWALSLSLPSRNGSDDTRRVVISSTLAIVLFTVIVLGGGMLPLLRLVRVEDEAAEVPDSDDQDNSEGSGELPDGTIIQESPSFASLFAQRLNRLDETWLRPTLVASSTRSMIATNRTLQTLAVSAVERLTPHELGSLLDSSAAMDSPPPGEALAAHGRDRGDVEMAVVNVNKGQLTLDSDS